MRDIKTDFGNGSFLANKENNFNNKPILREQHNRQFGKSIDTNSKSTHPLRTTPKPLTLDYHDSILSHLKQSEERYRVDPDYFSTQREITSTMRSILVDWLVDVSVRFRLQQQTLFLTVNVLDRFLSRESVTKNDLQLVGVSTLMLCSKYQEIYPPPLNDFVKVCDNAYSQQQILDFESFVILTIDFDLTQPTSLSFLDHFQLHLCLNERAVSFCKYILETALLAKSSNGFKNSELASGAILLIFKIFKTENWKDRFQSNVLSDERTSRSSAKLLCQLIQGIDDSSLRAVKRKYSTNEYHEVSKYKIERTESHKQ